LSKTPLNQDIPITPVGKDGQFETPGIEPSWKQKNGKLYWRGLATGMFHNKQGGKQWRQNHRERLHFLTNDRTGGDEDVMVPVGTTGQTKYERHSLKTLGEYYTNTKLAQGPWQCDEGDGTCAEMQSEIEFAPKDPKEEANKYKYILDTDGNAWSSRFPRLMQGLNVKLKATVFPEWNSLILPEWFTYVPVKMDYSDLYSILAFFRGSPSGRGSHDEVARRIARNGQCWVERSECSVRGRANRQHGGERTSRCTCSACTSSGRASSRTTATTARW
jgi:beta-1,2-xylosyltransferase